MEDNKAKRQLTTQVLENLRKVPSHLSLSQTQFVMYNLVEKASGTGLFKNERLLILNVKQQSLCYLSKPPNTLIPFLSEQQVLSQIPKEILYRSQVYEDGLNKIQCQSLPEKNGIEIKLAKRDKKIQWTFYFSNSELMILWFSHISFLFTRSQEQVDAFYHKKPVEQNKSENQINLPENEQKLQKEDPQSYQSPGQKTPEEREDNISPKNLQTQPFYQQESAKREAQYQKRQQQKPEEILTPVPITNSNEKELNEEEWKQKISELSQKKQKNSDFHQFEQNMPLGNFVRQDTSSKIKKNDDYQEPLEDSYQQSKIEQKYFPSQRSPYSNRSKFNRKPLDLPEQNKTEQIEKSNINSKVNEDSLSRKSSIHRPRSGTIMKANQSVSPKASRISIREDPGKQWNNIFYSERRFRTTVYFDFINQCTKQVKLMVSQLPLKYQQYSKCTKNQCIYRKIDGIEYFIGLEHKNEDSLIDKLEDFANKSNKVNLKLQFINQRERFNKDQQQNYPLAVYIQYKHIPVLCKAFSSFDIPKQQSIDRSGHLLQKFLLKGMNNATIHITSSADFRQLMRKNNVYSLDWTYLYNNCQNPYFQTIFLSQMYAFTFLNMIKNEIFDMNRNFPIQQLNNVDQTLVQQITTDSYLHLINRLLADSQEADQLWDHIQEQTERIYKIKGSREIINENYMLYSIILGCGMKWTGQRNNFRAKISNVIDKVKRIDHSAVSLQPLVECFAYQLMSPKYLQIKNHIEDQKSDLKSTELFQIRQQLKYEIPQEINYFINLIDLYLAKYIPFTKHGIASNLYSIINTGRPSSFNYQTAVEAVKWLIRQNSQEAGDLCFQKIQQVLYYSGRIPIITEFYDALAIYQLKQQQYEKGLSNFKKGTDNLITIFGDSHPLILERKIYLSNIYNDIPRNQQCLKQLFECKKICEANSLVKTDQYPQILAKISKITLSSGKINQSITTSLECLKYFQNNIDSPQQITKQDYAMKFLQVAELLLRSFQLSRRSQDSVGVANLCLERCKQVDSIKVLRRLLKIALIPYLKKCDFRDSRNLLSIVEDLGQIYRQSRLNKKILQNLVLELDLMQELQLLIPKYFKNLKAYYDSIQKERLMPKYKLNFQTYINSLQQKHEPIKFLNDFFLISNIVGVSFFQGLLKDSYYE